MQKFAPFILIVFSSVFFGWLLLVVFILCRAVDKLQNLLHKRTCKQVGYAASHELHTYQGTTGHNTSATRKEIAANNVLQHRTLATWLRPDNGNLRQVNRVVYAYSGKSVLQLIDYVAVIVRYHARSLARQPPHLNITCLDKLWVHTHIDCLFRVKIEKDGKEKRKGNQRKYQQEIVHEKHDVHGNEWMESLSTEFQSSLLFSESCPQ